MASGNMFDLKMALCIGLVGFTIFEVGAAAATPVWVTLTLFGLNHFVEMQSELAQQPPKKKHALLRTRRSPPDLGLRNGETCPCRSVQHEHAGYMRLVSYSTTSHLSPEIAREDSLAAIKISTHSIPSSSPFGGQPSPRPCQGSGHRRVG